MTNVLQEILAWSADRPAWQRDALRRLVLNGYLSSDDIRDLAEICKSEYGLAEKSAANPLTKDHVPDRSATAAVVALESVFHHKGVNALAEDQTLRFSAGLTVVYGDNGSGKTGYTRILKRACKSRGREEILGNVVSGVAPPQLIVSVKYKVGYESTTREWNGGGDEFVPGVSVFDTQSAAVYLNEKTDVAFLPFGLDLFDKLARACRAVRTGLEAEQRALNTHALVPLVNQIPQGTSAAKFMISVNSLTKPEAIRWLTRLSPEEQARHAFLEKALQDLQANDPEKLIRQLTIRASRVRALGEHLKKLEFDLSDVQVAQVFAVRKDGHRKREEATRLREATLTSDVLAGTGSERWKEFWESARSFSKEQAYPGKSFPVIDDGAQCVLCQQDLDHVAAHRLRKFEEFVTSTTERELQQLREMYLQKRSVFSSLKTATDAVLEAIEELRLEYDTIAEKIGAAIHQNERRRTAVIDALTENKDLPADFPAIVSVSADAYGILGEIESRIKSLREGADDEGRKKMGAELLELQARVMLGKHEQDLFDEVERKKKIAAYAQCIDETKSTAITQKGSAVTKAVVSNRLKKSFKEELLGLEFQHVDVELKEAGGTEGVFYHRLVLTRAPGVELPKVVSEGEQRCLSIAAFFAELSTADDRSGIVFDDPVSSLDFQWRTAVARRLVRESKARQVIVFTHDVVFLLALKQFANEIGVESLDQHVRYSSKGAGVCQTELPWVAMPVKKRIGHLKKERQCADKLYRDGHQDAYEKEAKNIYGLLREAWERGLEEVLLGGVVERYRPGVQTQQISYIADITAEDCKAVEIAMTKSSAWLRGHDQAAAARAPVPKPNELEADIEALENWVKAIHKRREKKKTEAAA